MRDLLRDEFFIKMVTNPDADSEHFWQQWLEAHPDRKGDIELARQVVQSLKYKKRKRLPSTEYNRMLTQLRAFKQSQDEKLSGYPLTNRRTLFPLVRVAAAILLLVGISLVVFYSALLKTSGEVASNEPLIEKTVPAGVKETIKLADGTMIKLNAGSKLLFPSHFNGTTRTVQLDGEAYFDVSRDLSRPFVIQTGVVRTEVLGTSFNVRCYQKEKNIEIALVSGSVRVHDGQGNTTRLAPTEMAVYSRSNQVLQKQKFNVRQVTAWKDNVLVFEKATMQEIERKLERWYGVRIKTDLRKPISGLYSGEFENESLNVVLQGIGYASGFKFKIEGKDVTINN